LVLALAPLLGPGQAAVVDAASGACTTSDGTATCTFSSTGAVQTWTVPAGVTQATFDVYGAQAPTVSFSCSDTLSSVQGSCLAAYTFPEGANESHTASVSDIAGNSASAGKSVINVDLTAPTVTYTGNAGSYTVDQQVEIICAARDATSGVALNTCQTISGPAYSLGLGKHSYSATATDNAGNSGNGSTSFTVTVTSSSLQALINRFCTDSSVAASLDQDVNNIAHAPNANAKAGILQGFTQLVQAQTGKSLTSDQANLLITLANAL
jgi:hypothetical protein